jgi:putative membrane protein
VALSAVAVLVFGLAVGAQGQRGAAKAEDQKGDDATFVKKAASGGMLEVKLGKLGVEKGQSDDVKKFAQRMVEDHGKANKELMALANQKGWTVPTQLLPKHQEMVDKLSRATGRDFDKAFWKAMADSHEEAVALFEAHDKLAKDQQLRSFIEKTLPTIKEHFQMAKQHASERGGTGR